MEKKTHTQYFVSGWITIAIGVISFILFLFDYHHNFIIKEYKDVSDFGAIIAATTGILFTLAGLFFILDNLETQRLTIKQQQHSIEQQKESIDLQRKELQNQILEMQESNSYFKDQASTLKLQTSEASFFQLLENHRSLIGSLLFNETGYSGLDKFYKGLKSETTLYFQAAVTGNIIKNSHASLYPIRRLGYQIENIEQIYNNIKHLVRLIQIKLGNDVFYHQIFYNSLSKAEKYILGLYTENIKEGEINIFQNDVFNYLEYFQGSGNAYFNKNKVPFFPNFAFSIVKPWIKFTLTKFYNKDLIDEIGKINIEVINNEFNFPIILKETKLEYDLYSQNYSHVNSIGMEIKDQTIINLFQVINNNIFSFFAEKFDVSKQRTNFSFLFKIIFVFSYNNKEYSYKIRFQCEAFNFHKDGADVNIKIDD